MSLLRHLKKKFWGHLCRQSVFRDPAVKEYTVANKLHFSLSFSDSFIRNFSFMSSRNNLFHLTKSVEGTNWIYCNVYCARSFSLTSSLFKKKKKSKSAEVVQDHEDAEIRIDDSILDDQVLEEWRSDSDIIGFIGSQPNYRFDMGVVVLQPWVKWGPRMKKATTAQLMLDEAATLIATLPGVRVVHKVICFNSSL